MDSTLIHHEIHFIRSDHDNAQCRSEKTKADRVRSYAPYAVGFCFFIFDMGIVNLIINEWVNGVDPRWSALAEGTVNSRGLVGGFFLGGCGCGWRVRRI